MPPPTDTPQKTASPKRSFSWGWAPTLLATILSIAIYMTVIHPKAGNWFTNDYYHMLTEAFDSKQLHLKEKPDPRLTVLQGDQLYIKDNREAWLKKVPPGGTHYIWDASLFENKYYLYYSAIPVLLAYWPYYKLTGTHLENWVFCMACSCIFLAATILTLRLLNKYRETRLNFTKQDTPDWVWVLILALSGPIPNVLQRVVIYECPILLGMVFSTISLFIGTRMVLFQGLDRISVICFGLTSSLAVLCRPSLAPSFLCFGLVVLYSCRKNLTMGKSALFLSTILLLGGGQAFYNYARFHNPLDFGWQYVLSNQTPILQRPSSWTSLIYNYHLFFEHPPLAIEPYPYMEIRRGSIPETKGNSEPNLGILYSTPIVWLAALIIFISAITSTKTLFSRLRGNPQATPPSNASPPRDLTFGYALLLCWLIGTLSLCHWAPGVSIRYQLDNLPFLLIGTLTLCKISPHYPKWQPLVIPFLVTTTLIFCVAPALPNSTARSIGHTKKLEEIIPLQEYIKRIKKTEETIPPLPKNTIEKFNKLLEKKIMTAPESPNRGPITYIVSKMIALKHIATPKNPTPRTTPQISNPPTAKNLRWGEEKRKAYEEFTKASLNPKPSPLPLDSPTIRFLNPPKNSSLKKTKKYHIKNIIPSWFSITPNNPNQNISFVVVESQTPGEPSQTIPIIKSKEGRLYHLGPPIPKGTSVRLHSQNLYQTQTVKESTPPSFEIIDSEGKNLFIQPTDIEPEQTTVRMTNLPEDFPIKRLRKSRLLKVEAGRFYLSPKDQAGSHASSIKAQ